MHPRILVVAAGLAGLAATGVVGCGDGRPAPQAATTTTEAARPDQLDLDDVAWTDATGAAAVEVVARDNEFVEPHLVVAAGTEVAFVNRGSRHDITPAVPGAFTTIPVDQLRRGTPVSVTFEAPGDYVYYCSIHGTPRKGMVGAIRVVG